MLKLIGVFLALATYHVCVKGSNVEKETWIDFLGQRGGASSSDERPCIIQAKCQSLGRVTTSCDTESVTVGCGSCLLGYREDAGARCLPVPGSSSGMEADQLIDKLASAGLVGESRDTDQLHLAERRDSSASAAADSSTSNGSAAGHPLIPPPPPDFAFYVIIGTTCGMGLLLIIICGICWYNYASKQADIDFATTTEYIPSSAGRAGDGKLALSAQMYHYQHQKQQMLAMERSGSDLQRDVSDDDSDLGNDEADFTVYECPGLAPTREMEVRNPLFKDDPETSLAGPSDPGTSGTPGGGGTSAAAK